MTDKLGSATENVRLRIYSRREDMSAAYLQMAWISMDEEWPKTEGMYIVWTEGFGHDGESRFAWYKGNGQWVAVHGVTHWMPRPGKPATKGL